MTEADHRSAGVAFTVRPLPDAHRWRLFVPRTWAFVKLVLRRPTWSAAALAVLTSTFLVLLAAVVQVLSPRPLPGWFWVVAGAGLALMLAAPGLGLVASARGRMLVEGRRGDVYAALIVRPGLPAPGRRNRRLPRGWRVEDLWTTKVGAGVGIAVAQHAQLLLPGVDPVYGIAATRALASIYERELGAQPLPSRRRRWFIPMIFRQADAPAATPAQP